MSKMKSRKGANKTANDYERDSYGTGSTLNFNKNTSSEEEYDYENENAGDKFNSTDGDEDYYNRELD